MHTSIRLGKIPVAITKTKTLYEFIASYNNRSSLKTFAIASKQYDTNENYYSLGSRWQKCSSSTFPLCCWLMHKVKFTESNQTKHLTNFIWQIMLIAFVFSICEWQAGRRVQSFYASLLIENECQSESKPWIEWIYIILFNCLTILQWKAMKGPLTLNPKFKATLRTGVLGS